MFKNTNSISIVVVACSLTFVFDSSSKPIKPIKKTLAIKPLPPTREEKAALMLKHVRLMQELKQYFVIKNKI